MKPFSVLITDSYRENKRTAKWREYLVLADSSEAAESLLRRERPSAFLYARAVETTDHSGRISWLLGNGYVDKQAADVAYERAGCARRIASATKATEDDYEKRNDALNRLSGPGIRKT